MSFWYRYLDPSEVGETKRAYALAAVKVAIADLELDMLTSLAELTNHIGVQWYSTANGTEEDFRKANQAAITDDDKPYFQHPIDIRGILYRSGDGQTIRLKLSAGYEPLEIAKTVLHEMRHLYQWGLERAGRHYICKPEDDADQYAAQAIGKVEAMLKPTAKVAEPARVLHKTAELIGQNGDAFSGGRWV